MTSHRPRRVRTARLIQRVTYSWTGEETRAFLVASRDSGGPLCTSNITAVTCSVNARLIVTHTFAHQPYPHYWGCNSNFRSQNYFFSTSTLNLWVVRRGCVLCGVWKTGSFWMLYPYRIECGNIPPEREVSFLFDWSWTDARKRASAARSWKAVHLMARRCLKPFHTWIAVWTYSVLKV